MSDIELVIKISEIEYEHLTNKEKFYSLTKSKQEWLINKILDRVVDGTPLSKGHGRLKDTDAICKDIISALGIRDENYLLEAEEAVYKRIKNAPTIIEADKSESEDKE